MFAITVEPFFFALSKSRQTQQGIVIESQATLAQMLFLLAGAASIASIKLTAWLVNTVEHKILASTIGLLNTILMASSPVMTTIFTTISGMSSVVYALIALLVVELLVLAGAVKINFKVRPIKKKIGNVDRLD